MHATRVQVGQDYSALNLLNTMQVSEDEPVLVTVGSNVLEKPTARSEGLVKLPFCSSGGWFLPRFDYNPHTHTAFTRTVRVRDNKIPFVPTVKTKGGIYVMLGIVARGHDGAALLHPMAASFLPIDFDPAHYEHQGGCESALRCHVKKHRNRLLDSGADLSSDGFIEQLAEVITLDGHVVLPADATINVRGQRVEIDDTLGKLFAHA